LQDTFILYNAQSLVNKLCELHHILYHDKFDLVFVTETWLHADIPSGLLDPESMYYVLRRDRAFGHSAVCGGGVCVFVNRSLSVAETDISSVYNQLELICFELLCVQTKLRFFHSVQAPL